MDRSASNKATSADDTPTPGYLYTEIAQSTFADLNACQQLADYLIKKLEKDNPHVKSKCLKIIKHVCEQGKPEFKRAIQRKAEVVKACLQYRGTPDPLKGDAPNKAVREEADLAVKAVFSSNASLNAYGFSTGQGKKMQGFGSEPSEDISSRIGNSSSNSFSGGGGGSFEGGGRSFGSGGMVGFGNPNFDNAPPRKDDDSVFNKAMSSTMSAVSYLQSKVTGAPPPPMPSSGVGSDGTYRPPAVGGGFGGDRGGGDHRGFGGGFNSSYSGGSGYSAPSHSYSAAGGQQNYGIHGPGGAHRRWGHRTAGDGSDARGGDGGRSEAHEATPEAKPAPPPAMVDLLDMEEPSPAQPPGGNSASSLDEGPSAPAASEDLLGGGESLMETLNSQTPSFSIPPGEVPGNSLMGGIDMTTAAPANVANAAAAQGAGGGCGCGGGMPGMGMAGSVGGSMGSQAPMMGQPPMPQAGGSMGSSMGNPMGQPPMGGGPMGGAMGMGGGMGMGMGAMGGMGPMGMGAMGCGGCGGCNCGGCGMGGPQMGCGCGMGAMGCGPPMGGPMGMCGGCNMQGSMGGCAPNMGMGMMPQQPMNSMNQAAYSPPAAAPPPYQNGSMPMQAMGSMSTPSGSGSAFSFIGGSSASSQISPQVAPKPPDMAFGFVAEEMKGAVG